MTLFFTINIQQKSPQNSNSSHMHNYDGYTIWISVQEYLVIYAVGDGKGLGKLGSHDGIIILSTCSYNTRIKCPEI